VESWQAGNENFMSASRGSMEKIKPNKVCVYIMCEKSFTE